MFEFLFKYSPAVFSKGEFVFLSGWPVWLLALLMACAAAALGWLVWQRYRARGLSMAGARPVAVWLLQSLLVALLLTLLWRPALSVATLNPQQNIVAVLVDDSRSMALDENGTTRQQQAKAVLQNGMLDALRQRFQVRLYSVGENAKRVQKVEDLKANQPATQLGASLRDVAAESISLPIGAVVLLSDGSDNAGGIDLQSLNEIRSRRIPVHTIGFGPERIERDVEIDNVQLPTRTLANARVAAQVSFTQRGYAGKKARLTLKDGNRVVASQEVTFKQDGMPQTENVPFSAGAAGVRILQASIDAVPQERNANNNALTRLLDVEQGKRRILYIEGEPRWEFKFIRRALEDDPAIQLTSVLRTTQNKLYRQGVADSNQLQQGFPSTVEELFGYEGIIVGSVESGYFTSTQQEMLKQFVDRRGGGLLLLAGRNGLSDGGYGNSALAEALPTVLPAKRNTFRRDPARAALTQNGRDSLITRLTDTPEKNTERWKSMTLLGDYQEIGTSKPGAVTLMEAEPTSGGRLPLLVTQSYGRGRTAVFGSSGSWRWQMEQDHTDQTHEMFWKQLARWLVTDTPGALVSSVGNTVLQDASSQSLRVEVRDKTFAPVPDARVMARVSSPDGTGTNIEMRADPSAEGVYLASLSSVPAGSYGVEVSAERNGTDLGRSNLAFRKETGQAENFHTAQNRELLQRLSAETGGRYYQPNNTRSLTEDITYSEAGLNTREMKDLWDMPIVFLTILLLRGSEWLLRRRWGAV